MTNTNYQEELKAVLKDIGLTDRYLRYEQKGFTYFSHVIEDSSGIIIAEIRSEPEEEISKKKKQELEVLIFESEFQDKIKGAIRELKKRLKNDT